MTTRNPLFDYIIDNQSVLLNIDFLKEIWMNPERIFADDIISQGDNPVFKITCPGYFYKGKLFVYENEFYSVVSYRRIDDRSSENKIYEVSGTKINVKYNKGETKPLCTPQDTFTLNSGEILNYKNSQSVETTIGRFVSNYLFLVYPFKDNIPYINTEFSSSKLESVISDALVSEKITARDIKDRYVPTLSLIGQSNDIICPNISEKTITIPPHIHALREKLVKENKEALLKGDASVMSDIEAALVKAYKEYLEGDPSLHFLLKKKYFNVTLKKLFLTQGMVERFGSPGQFDFVENPMGNGWKIKDLPIIFNEVRHGSYSRAIETQNGGVIAKLILRVFQDTRISIDDCKTKRGETVFASRDNLKEFENNYMIAPEGKNILITSDIMGTIPETNITVRTPGYCQAEKGFCSKCFGHLFEVVGQKAFAPVANDFARVITTTALKTMHGKSHETIEIGDLNKYLVIN